LFTEFIEILSVALKGVLPAEPAQFKMAPKGRLLRKVALLLNPIPKLSAVLVLLYPKNKELHLVLMLRNEYNGVHSAQVSFPGGKRENKESLQKTALREAEEEIGVDAKKVKIIGKLSDLYIPPSGYLVTPFVGYSNKSPEFNPDPTEVQRIIEVPVSLIMDESTVKRKKIKVSTGNLKLNYPYFDVYGHTVWGATAMMLSELKEIIRANKIEF